MQKPISRSIFKLKKCYGTLFIGLRGPENDLSHFQSYNNNRLGIEQLRVKSKKLQKSRFLRQRFWNDDYGYQ